MKTPKFRSKQSLKFLILLSAFTLALACDKPKAVEIETPKVTERYSIVKEKEYDFGINPYFFNKIQQRDSSIYSLLIHSTNQKAEYSLSLFDVDENADSIKSQPLDIRPFYRDLIWADNSYYSAGITDKNNDCQMGPICKYDSAFNLLWTYNTNCRHVPLDHQIKLYAIDSSQILVVYNNRNYKTRKEQYTYLILSSEGKVIKSKSHPSDFYTEPINISQTKDGNILVTLVQYDSDAGKYKYQTKIEKISPKLEIIWTKIFENSKTLQTLVNSTGEFLFISKIQVYSQTKKTQPNLERIWTKTVESSKGEFRFISESQVHTQAKKTRLKAMMTTENGTVKWEKLLNEYLFDMVGTVIETEDSTYLLSATGTPISDIMNKSLLIIELSGFGEILSDIKLNVQSRGHSELIKDNKGHFSIIYMKETGKFKAVIQSTTFQRNED